MSDVVRANTNASTVMIGLMVHVAAGFEGMANVLNCAATVILRKHLDEGPHHRDVVRATDRSIDGYR